MIAPTLLKAILIFCTTNKFLTLKTDSLKRLSQICNLSAFERILDLISKNAGAEWTE